MKASEKQAICKKLVTLLKKRYKSTVPKNDRPILETILYSICLEDASYHQADNSYQRLFETFYDLNEIRVSTITELATIFDGQAQAEWRALRLRNTLHYVFEKSFEFEFEVIRRKTLDLAQKNLSRIKELSSFVKLHTLQTTLGAHLVPVDQSILNAIAWLGFVEEGTPHDKGSDAMKSATRKADAPLVFKLLRDLSTDPKIMDMFVEKPPEEGYDLSTAPERLKDLLDNADKRRVKKKAPAKKAKSTGAKKKAAKTRKKTTAKKNTKKKSTAKKTTKKKATASKKSRKTAAKKKKTRTSR